MLTNRLKVAVTALFAEMGLFWVVFYRLFLKNSIGLWADLKAKQAAFSILLHGKR